MLPHTISTLSSMDVTSITSLALCNLIRQRPEQLIFPPILKPSLDELLEIQSPFTFLTCQFDDKFEKLINRWLCACWMVGSNKGVRLISFNITGHTISPHVLLRNIPYVVHPPTVSRSIRTPANVEVVVVGGYGIKNYDKVEATIAVGADTMNIIVWESK